MVFSVGGRACDPTASRCEGKNHCVAVRPLGAPVGPESSRSMSFISTRS